MGKGLKGVTCRSDADMVVGDAEEHDGKGTEDEEVDSPEEGEPGPEVRGPVTDQDSLKIRNDEKEGGGKHKPTLQRRLEEVLVGRPSLHFQ